ncbi:PHP domain-containing protein [Facklamia sp. P12945]
MLIDLHMHEKTFSPDSFMKIEQIVERAKLIGLDAVCITDHDSIGFMTLVEEAQQRLDFPIFVGVEYLTTEGDVLAYGIDELPEPGLSAQEFIDYVNKKGGACTAAHPYRNNNRGLGDHIYKVKGLHAVEVLNGNSTLEENQQAFITAKEHGLQCVGGSDSHHFGQVGVYATYFPNQVSTIHELAQELKKGNCQPVMVKGHQIIETVTA